MDYLLRFLAPLGFLIVPYIVLVEFKAASAQMPYFSDYPDQIILGPFVADPLLSYEMIIHSTLYKNSQSVVIL